MPSEPDWSKQIANSSVCTWFYALAILNGIFGAAGVLGSLYLLAKGKSSVGTYLLVLFSALFGFINSWFLFLVCSRGLNSEGFENQDDEDDYKKEEGFRRR